MSGKLNVATVGAGSFAGGHACKGCDSENTVVLCDVDGRVLEARSGE